MTAWIDTNYRYVFEENADPRTHTLPLITSPMPIALILIIYHRFVYKIGPEFMKDRKPFNLDRIIQVFNVVQIIACCYLVIMGTPYLMDLNWRCSEVDYTSNSMGIVRLGYLYFLLKVLDLCDTIFFVLRKKTSQVTFLHVYHHIGMVIISWIVMKYYAGGHSCYLAYINSIIHAIMYTYYLVSNYTGGTHTIWWKKYITQLQLVQFVILTFLFAQPLIRPSCGFSKFIATAGFTQALYMMVLFGKFYYKAYIKSTK